MQYDHEFGDLLHQALVKLQHADALSLDDVRMTIEEPKDASLGDLAFPCFRLARVFRKAPQAIAENLVGVISDLMVDHSLFERIQAVGPYINVNINKSNLAASLIPTILDGSLLAPIPSQNVRVMIEYSQPNTHKAFHVGHTRNAALGDALIRIHRWCGFDVVAANYIGDVGAHIAKCLWYLETQYQGPIPASHRGEFLGDMYTKAIELLDFSLLSDCPMLKVFSATVTSKTQHPIREDWCVVKVRFGQQNKQVVCAGSGFEVGYVVAYASVGARVGSRRMAMVDKEGVQSEGMILSFAEMGISEDRQAIYCFDKNTQDGVAVADLFAIQGAVPDGESVSGIMTQRLDGVSHTLKKLESGDPKTHKLWEETREWSMAEFHAIYAWLDCQFDHFFYESDVGDEGKKIVQEYLEKGVFVHSQGAVGADLERFGLPFLLLRKSDGTGLYATKDLALARRKFDDFHVDESIYVVDASQSLHFQQVFKTLELMGFEKAKLCYHLAYGLVVLPDGKMSSRKGNVILFSQLKAKLDQEIRNDFLNKYVDDWSSEEIEAASRAISIATVKYGMLSQDHGKNIVFDLKEWTSQSGNTGPYLMYAYARTQSIARKLNEHDVAAVDFSLLTHESEGALIHHLAKFNDTVELARKEHKPREICAYLYDLARAFSRMFDHCSVLHAETSSLRTTRAQLVAATGEVLKTGLGLLGISTLDRM